MPEKYFGKYTGIVKDNRDDQKLGHLKVFVPAIFPADDEEDVVIARPALPYGFYFVPEKDAKVWVEFEGGDPDLPLWTGLQYVPGEWAKEGEASPPQKRVIKTAAGHIVLFNDRSGEEAIEIHDGIHKHVICLNKDGLTIEDGTNSHSITLGKKGVSVEANGGITMELKTSGVKVELAAKGITIDSGSVPTTVKGSVVNLGGDAPTGGVFRVGVDQAIGNMGAPIIFVPSTGSTVVKAM